MNATIPSHVDSSERTPLHYARSACVVELLRQHDASVHRKCGPTEETPLHAVVSSEIPEEQKVETCRCLLDGFAEYKHGALNTSLQSPLDMATEIGHLQLVKLFDDEEHLRIENYEQMQLDLVAKSELNLSLVEAMLAEGIETKRANVSERIDGLVKKIKSKRDEGPAARLPGSMVRTDHRLQSSGGFAFDETPFEIFLTSRAADRLFAVDQDTAQLLLTSLFELANTNRSTQMVSDDITQGFNIFSARIAKHAWLVGERAAVYSTRVQSFCDSIRIWNILVDRDDALVLQSKETLLSSLLNGSDSTLATYLTRVSDGTEGPSLYAATDGETGDARHVPLAEPGLLGQSIVKLHQLSTFMAISVTEPNAKSVTAREHPFHPAMKEAKVMLEVSNQQSSCLLLGRSGTGKTTLLSNQLFSQYRLKCPRPAPEQQASRPFNQIFVTRNSVLVSCVRKSFRDMCQESPTLPDLGEIDSDGNDTAFPYFLSRRAFLEFVDSHLRTSYFSRDQTWARSEGDVMSLDLQLAQQRLHAHRKHQADLIAAGIQDPAERVQAHKDLAAIDHQLQDMQDVAVPAVKTGSPSSMRRGKCIDFEFFRSVMWGRMESGNRVSPSAVWTEIVSYITGSTDALRNGGALSEAQYLKLSTKVSATFRPDAETTDALSRRYVFAIFTKYQLLKKKLGCWDEAELVSHIYQQLSTDGWQGPPIHSLAADEVQDFTQAECWVMVNICANGNSLFLCGDTAQVDTAHFAMLSAFWFARSI